MSFHTCWDIAPAEGQPSLPLPDVLGRIAASFPFHTFDAESARQSALRRLAALESIGASEEVLAAYREARPVDVVLADSPDDEYILDFTIWPEDDGLVRGLQVSFATAEHQHACAVHLSRLADALSWETIDVSDEVA